MTDGTRRYAPRMTKEQLHAARKEWAEAYEAGASIRDIAAEVGRAYTTVHGILSRAGVTFRSRGGYKARKNEDN